jgi:hypothetical protein
MNVERMQEIEKQLSIELRSVAAIVEDEWVMVNGEINALSKGSIPQDVEIVAAAYNDRNEVVGRDSVYFYEDSFLGFDTFSISIESHGHRISRIKVYPKKG